MSGYHPDYAVDFVICFDATSSMNPYLEKAKHDALSYYQKVIHEINLECGVDVEKDGFNAVKYSRIKVITFRDADIDPVPFRESRFFNMPEESALLKTYLDSIKTRGPETTHSNALEALALALKSDWTKDGDRRRHVVVIYTDKEAHPLGREYKTAFFPKGMPKDLKELGEWWEGTTWGLGGGTYQPKSGRLVAFAPNTYPWDELQKWNRYWPAFSPAGSGLEDVDIQLAVDIMFVD